MIGIEEGGVSRVGVVRFPGTGETIGAWSGGGCYLNGERCRRFGYGNAGRGERHDDGHEVFRPAFRRAGAFEFRAPHEAAAHVGDCYGYLMVATGRADLMFDPDRAALRFPSADPHYYRSRGALHGLEGRTPTQAGPVLATNGRFHDEALEMFRSKA
jgi:histidinol-phosphatase